MNTKPATPLPWKVNAWRANQKRRLAISFYDEHGVPRNVASLPYAMAMTEYSDDMAADAAYIVHACNAYPRLVEALRKLSSCCDVHRGVLGFDETPVESDAKALVRELGEQA